MDGMLIEFEVRIRQGQLHELVADGTRRPEERRALRELRLEARRGATPRLGGRLIRLVDVLRRRPEPRPAA